MRRLLVLLVSLELSAIAVWAFHSSSLVSLTRSCRLQPGGCSCFSDHRSMRQSQSYSRRRSTALYINFNWFSGNKNETSSSDSSGAGGDKNLATSADGAAASTAGMGGVAATMESMENFQTSQRAGKITRKLVQDLASTTVEGVAGGVKVVLDCSQRPISVDIDEAYLDVVDAAELCSSIVSAMSDAHTKSIERMEEKMKGLYSELGLPSSNS